MEKPNVDLKIKQKPIMIPIGKFLSAEHDYGDISDELAELKDFHIEMEKQVYEELALENTQGISSIYESPVTVPKLLRQNAQEIKNE